MSFIKRESPHKVAQAISYKEVRGAKVNGHHLSINKSMFKIHLCHEDGLKKCGSSKEIAEEAWMIG